MIEHIYEQKISYVIVEINNDDSVVFGFGLAQEVVRVAFSSKI